MKLELRSLCLIAVTVTACKQTDPVPTRVQPSAAPARSAESAPAATSDSESESAEASESASPSAAMPGSAWPAGVSVENVSVRCKPTTKPGYKTTGNARFAFCLDIPKDWKEGEQSGNGDGSDLLVPGVEEMSFYGTNFDGLGSLAGEYERRRRLGDVPGRISDIKFDDGTSGKAIQQGNEHEYLRPAKGHFAVLHVKADDAWLRAHAAEVLAVARSLRDAVRLPPRR